MLTQYNKENPTYEDVLHFTFDPEIVSIIESQHHRSTDGIVTLNTDTKSPDYIHTLEHEGYVRKPIKVYADDIKKLFNTYIDEILAENWQLLVQHVSDILLNGLVSKNGIYITTDRYKHVQIKNLYDLSMLFDIEIKEDKMTIENVLKTIEPYIRDLFSDFKEYFID